MAEQTPGTSDYFSFFGLPVGLAVDADTLRKAYLKNSRLFHPDFHTLSSAEEQARMLEMSTLNNEAYKTLSDPDARLHYVLTIKGLLTGGSKEEKLPQDFLMEMMDINELIMELEFDADPGLYKKALAAVEELEKSVTTPVRGVLETWTEKDGDSALPAVLDYFLKKRYLLRVKENLSKFAPAFE